MTKTPFYPFKTEEAKAEYEAYCLEAFKAWPAGSQTLLFETPSGETFVRACGRETDPPLVLLAGARGSSLMWTRTIAGLSTHHRCYALDTIGDAGFSVNRHDLKKPEDFVQWLDEVLPELVSERPVSLMGMSYGGWLAGQYALHRPERVQSVVLLAPGDTVLRTSFAFYARVALLAVPVPGKDGTLRRMLRWVFRDAVEGNNEAREAVEEAIAYVELTQRLFSLPRPPWPTVIDDEGWRNFRVPCMFMVGENEKIYSAEAAVERLNRVAPQVKTEIIPGAGHDLTMVQPELVISKALGFLTTQMQAAA
jgi:pimeloyl-ACP methyl ester carboxylesterase